MRPVSHSLKPRNPFVAPACLRKAGAHGPSNKALRLGEKRALKQALRHLDAHPPHPR